MKQSLHWRHRVIATGLSFDLRAGITSRREVYMNFYPEMGVVHLTGFKTLFEPEDNLDFAWYTEVTGSGERNLCVCGKCK